eukprot:CAMPEP_0201532192 /NCGR_PEP_ID=MMETSP0161_2-20130828/49714_1 /ASSEMBLY_ACC=CAM_ASM_000251 /TAXON_ID=180227 /ORGANISM="Neoparamoeba aestuarina, Strain SoJaBio B1-5/56/2" /LENGTH=41 /DNA_ID= /DNA_START= /DNA_END= /DNA_ORIENTATION=
MTAKDLANYLNSVQYSSTLTPTSPSTTPITAKPLQPHDLEW